jgi:putative endonuclease
MRTSSQQVGDAAERLVEDYLASEGWSILGRNIRIGRGELDIVAVDPAPPASLVCVEVRWRRSREYGLPEETFDRRKRSRLWAGVMRMLQTGELPNGNPLPRLPLRVDLVVVEPPLANRTAPRIRHHRDVLSG